MTNLAILSETEIASLESAAFDLGKNEGKLETILAGFADTDGKFSRINKANYELVRERCILAYVAGKLGIGTRKVTEATRVKVKEAVKLPENKKLYGAFRVAFHRACERVGFPVHGKNAGNTNKTGKGKNAAGAPATGKGKGKGAATPQNAPVAPVMVAPAKVTARDIATASKAIGGLGDLDRAFRRAAALLDAVAKKNAKLEGSQPYVELAARLYSELAKLPVVE